ncbi:MAG TPA: hypothetical protein VFM56_12210, partial [Solimonas sp.]|nr:hypothetical protein [Solimonas sp.]
MGSGTGIGRAVRVGGDVEKRVSHAVAWHGVSRGEWFLLLGACAYVVGTLGAQALSALPSFAAGSALERSSDIAASCGLVIAAWQATAHWSR